MSMPISSHLLERARQLIDANQIQNAELVLDAVVRVDPQNVDAWKIYLQIHQDRSDLEWLKERILKTRELNEQDKVDILDYQYCLLQQLNKIEEGTTSPELPRVYNIMKKNEKQPQGDKALFELIDVFDYPALKSENVPPKKSNSGLINKPLSTANSALALIVLFYFAVRLLVLGYFFGYILLAIFITAGVFWLRKFGNQKSVIYTKPARTFYLESKTDLPIADKTDASGKKGLAQKTSPRPPHKDKHS